MSEKYPSSWYHGHKHVLDALNHIHDDNVPVGVKTVRESLFEMEIDLTLAPDATIQDMATVFKVLDEVGFSECPGAHEDDPMTHRFEWTWDGY